MEITEEQYERIKSALPVQRGQCEFDQPAGAERRAVCGRAGLQVARSSQAFRPLAHDLYPHEPLVQERRSGSRVREVAGRADRPHQARSGLLGLHFGEGASGRHRRFKKNGPQSIGKSRGGWNTKIHMVAADARTAIAFALSPGNAHDAPEGRELLWELATHAGGPSHADGSCL